MLRNQTFVQLAFAQRLRQFLWTNLTGVNGWNWVESSHSAFGKSMTPPSRMASVCLDPLAQWDQQAVRDARRIFYTSHRNIFLEKSELLRMKSINNILNIQYYRIFTDI